MNNIFWNPEEIRIPPNTLVAICGANNSGKTTFSCKVFNENLIISTDTIFKSIVTGLINTTKADLGITKYSAQWSAISKSLGRIAILKAKEIIEQRIVSSQGNVVVLDHISSSFAQRLDTLLLCRSCFEQVYLMVIHPPLETLLKQEPKTVSDDYSSLGFYYPNQEQIYHLYLDLDFQIESCAINYGVEKVFIFNNPNSDVKILY